MNEQYEGRSSYIRNLMGFKDLSKGEIDRKVADRYGTSTAAARAARLRLNLEEPEPVSDVEPEQDLFLIDSKAKHYAYWRRSDDQYLFHIDYSESRRNNGRIVTFDIPAKQIQWICDQYTYAGAGKTQKTICRELGVVFGRQMQHETFRFVLQALGIDKNSPPVAPHRYLSVVDEDIDAIVNSVRVKREAAVELRKRETDLSYYIKRNDELVEKLADIDAWVSELGSVDVPTYPRVEIESTKGPPEVPVHIFSDWHVGATAYTTEHTAPYLVKQLAEFYGRYQGLLTSPVVFFCGDILDGVQGDMHPEQWRHQHCSGVEQVVCAVNQMVQVVSYLHQQYQQRVQVAYVTGNHDRSGAHRSEDPERIMGQVLGRWAASETRDYADWVYPAKHSTLVDTRVGSTQILAYHGDRQPKDWRKLLLANQNKDARYHLLLSGHRHAPELRVAEDVGVMVYRVGSTLNQDLYAKERLGLGYRPSQQVLLIGDKGPHLPGQLML